MFLPKRSKTSSRSHERIPSRIPKMRRSSTPFSLLNPTRHMSSTCSPLTSQLSSILTHPNWQRHPSLHHLLPSISPSHVSSLFSLPNLPPQTALSFFNWIALKPHFRHTPHSHSSLLSLLLPTPAFLSVAQNLRISMIKSSASAADALFVLHRLRFLAARFHFAFNLRSFNFLLMSLARFSLLDDLKALYMEMTEGKAPVKPNLHTLNTMVNAYCKSGNVVEAEVYFSKITEAGFRPDTFSYTSLILGHCKNKDVESARKVFDVMPEKGCRRNAVSYTNLIHGLCEADRIDEAFEFYSRMGEDGCQPTVRTFTVLINALCRLGRRLEAMKLFKEMLGKGCERMCILIL